MMRKLSTLAAIGLIWAAVGTAKADTLYVANQGDNTIHRFATSGTDLGGFSAGGNAPEGNAIDKSGNLYVSLDLDNVIREFSPNGTDLGIFANTGLANPDSMTFEKNGNMYIVNYDYGNAAGIGSYIRIFSPTGTDLGVFASGLTNSTYAAFDASGNLYTNNTFDTNDPSKNTIEKFSPTGRDLGVLYFASGMLR